MACVLNLLEPVHYFTLRGVDYEASHGPYNKSALHLAVEYGNVMTIKYLLNNGADLEKRDSFGFDIYEKAEYRGYYDFKKIFDYFKNNKALQSVPDYEKVRNAYPIFIDDMAVKKSRNFSQMLEVSVVNSLKNEKKNKAGQPRFDLDKFNINFYNSFNLIEHNSTNKFSRI